MPSTISTTTTYTNTSTTGDESNATDSFEQEYTTSATQITNNFHAASFWNKPIFGIALWQWILMISGGTAAVG